MPLALVWIKATAILKSHGFFSSHFCGIPDCLYRNFTCNFTFENVSYVNCFNFICEMKIWCVLYMFCTPRFLTWNFEPVCFTCELGISYVKMSPFHMWNENFMCYTCFIHQDLWWNFESVCFTCECGILYVKTYPFHIWNENFICKNVTIPHVVHMWKGGITV